MLFTPPTATEVLPREFSGNAFKMPVTLLLELHNSLETCHPMRVKLRQFIQSYGLANKKAHWTRAIVLRDDGSLFFDRKLYDKAVYRGKQETYTESAQRVLKELQFALDRIGDNQKSEDAADASLASGCAGQPLLEVAPYSPDAAVLKTQGDAVRAIAASLEQGLAHSILNLSAPEVPPSLPVPAADPVQGS